MSKLWVLNFCLLIGIFKTNAFLGFWKILPEEQTAKENEDVTVDCINTVNDNIHWNRKDGSPLPKSAEVKRGRLTINRIKFKDAGYYVCSTENGSIRKEALIIVKKRNKATKLNTSELAKVVLPTTNYPFRVNLGFTPAPVFSTAKPPVTQYPCLHGLCNSNSSTEIENFFDCANGQKINKSLVCNQHNDCEDGSDEAKCSPWPPKITVLPEQKVEVFCGDQEKSKAGVLILECRSVGHPVPLIKWKKYEGHVPSKCVQTSQGGRGRLECPDFQQSDQGSYSCVAENSVESAQSQPRSIAKCSNNINCKGFKVVNEEQIEHCLECFCSGKTSQCQNIKSNLTIHKFKFPETKTEVFAVNDGEVVFVPTKTQLSPDSKIRDSAKEITYCSLSEDELKEVSFLKSFGRNIIIPRFKGKSDFLPRAPDLIIQGKEMSLFYNFNKISPSSESSLGVAIRFWPGNWHINKKVASREDLMKVLSKVDSLLLRCEYVQGEIMNTSLTANISLESSAVTNFTNSVSYVEKCNCPVGYDGLSCESCAEGYAKKYQGNDFVCQKIYVPPKICKLGYMGVNCTACDEYKGYVKQGDQCVKFVCDPVGSLSASPNAFGKCTCKNGVTGDFCDKCENDHFYLQKDKGCSKCWCSGITNQCRSSKLYRTVISKTPFGGYNSSNGRNFWLLPSDFSGNRLTSYGGYLNYTMKYKPGIPKENDHLMVEFLTAQDDTIIYTHPSVDRSTLKEEKSWSVPLTEQNWRKSDKSSVTRDEFLSVLVNIKAIYIESPYHLSSGQANLTTTRMSSATPHGDDDNELALEVEQCNCPVGYSGLSCEKCSEGFYKKRNGSITLCLKCNCTYCDPDFGCPDCPGLTYRDNPEDDKIPVCKPCPCSNNALGCSKDDYNQLICRCKPGFTGMHCDKTMTDVIDNDLTLRISPRRIRNKRVGVRVSFTCSYSSTEEMLLSAQKTFGKNQANSLLNPLINAENVSVNGHEVVKHYNIALEYGLEFVECFVHDAGGKLAGHIRAVVEDMITVIKPVKITNCYSTVIDVKESESKDLICEASGSPPPMITWYKGGKNKTAEKVDTVDGVHSIASATLDQNGTIYTCVAENSEGDKATCPKVLIVKKKCEIVVIIPPEVREEEGKNISLLCKTSAKSDVTWSRLQHPLPLKSSVEDGYLTINNATLSDSGTYICKAKDQNQNTINKTVTVIVDEKKIPPSVMIPDDDKVLQVGDFFEVKCVGHGKPAPLIKWKKVNDIMGTNVKVIGNVISINKATVQNTGIYVCEGQSHLGNSTAYISIEVRPAVIRPTVTISEGNIKAHDGEEVNVTCTAKGYPQPSIVWYMPGFNNTEIPRRIGHSATKSTDSSLVVKETVTFKVSQGMDGMNLVCHAAIENNTAETDTKITVFQSKEITNERVEFARLGSYFLLHCGSINDNVTWEKSGKLLGDECKVLNGLMFESVQVQHNGTYTCKTQYNSKEIIHLRVIGFVPKFNHVLRSYMVLNLHVKTSEEIRIEISFNPTRENGLLLQRENHILDLYLKARKIHLGVHSTDGDFYDIVMKEEIELRKWYLLIVSIRPQYVDITIYGEKTFIYGRKTENLKNINIGSGEETFFIGGTVRGTSMRHPQKFFLSRLASFDGCISRLRINKHEVNFVKDSSYSHKVHLCSKCLEQPNVCQGKGKCLDAPTQYGFICVCQGEDDSKKSTCPAGCYGKGCETQWDLCQLLNPCSKGILHKCMNKMNHLQCDCAYGYSGATCERVVEHSFCTKDGYVKLPDLFERNLLNSPEIIEMAFMLNNPNGVLLWQGGKTNYLSISAENGKMKYIYKNQNSTLTAISANELPLKKKVHLTVKRMNNTVVMRLGLLHEGTEEKYKNFTGFTTNRVFGDIYLGNVPSYMKKEFSGLDGCIYSIAFGEKPKVDLREKELERMNAYLPQNEQQELDSEDDSYDLDETNGIDNEF